MKQRAKYYVLLYVEMRSAIDLLRPILASANVLHFSDLDPAGSSMPKEA
ncbi:MAG: hypothetical protein ABSG57_08085 [Candidatus Bathyarchaeia archaeon]